MPTESQLNEISQLVYNSFFIALAPHDKARVLELVIAGNSARSLIALADIASWFMERNR